MSLQEEVVTTNPEVVQAALNNLRKTEFKNLIKEAITEWLDTQATKFGRWSIRFLSMAALGALTYFVLTSQGWHKI